MQVRIGRSGFDGVRRVPVLTSHDKTEGSEYVDMQCRG